MPNQKIQQTYRTTQGDMWDVIALRLYGTETLMYLLLEANYQYRDVTVFPANCELVVPPMPKAAATSLLPWRTG